MPNRERGRPSAAHPGTAAATPAGPADEPVGAGPPRAGAAAYVDLVAGLLDLRDDLATTRFDLALQAAVAAGDVSPEAARSLRFWQRAAVRELAEHAVTVLPAALDALDRSRAEAAARLAADETMITADKPPITGTAGEPAPTLSEQASGADDRRRQIVAALTRSTMLDLRARHQSERS